MNVNKWDRADIINENNSHFPEICFSKLQPMDIYSVVNKNKMPPKPVVSKSVLHMFKNGFKMELIYFKRIIFSRLSTC